MSDFVKQSVSIIGFKTSESWIITNSVVAEIKKKVEEVGTPLEEWNINFYRGILTGCNDAFIIDSKKRADLIKEDPKSAEIIRPILRGKDIKRYQCNFANLWLIAAHNGLQEQNIKRVDINEYPAIKKHLDKFYDTISVRDDQGDTPYNLRSCAYMDDFSKPKLMYREISQRLSFIYVEEEVFCSNTAYFIANNDHLKYLLACLNSNLFDWYFKMFAVQLGDATRMLAMCMRKLPIPMVDSIKEEEINKIIDEILADKNKETNIKLLDQIIYEICGLNADEIKYIEDLYKEN